MSTNKAYYIGLDMGTNSVGWAVTDEGYKLLRAKGKDMWGVRLFDDANTAAERRSYRVARRRRQREVARIGLVKEYFADAIAEVDEGFYHRLEESKYWLEDRSEDNQQVFALFNDEGFTDKEYYAAYPTIYHLRNELLHSTEPHDVRLVFLAVHNLFKRRGHFLNKNLSMDGAGASFADAYQTLVDEAAALELTLPAQIDVTALEKCLRQQQSRTVIYEDVVVLLGLSSKKSEDKAQKALFKLVCGLSPKMKDIFGEDVIGKDNTKLAFSFRDSDYEEKLAATLALIGDENSGLLLAAKEIHDMVLLGNILNGETYLSTARVKSYEAHKADLKQLKDVLKRYNKKAYHDMFRTMDDNSYSAYVGSVNYKNVKVRRNGGKGKSAEDFYKAVKKVLNALPEAAQKDADVCAILQKIDIGDFMPKQLTAANGCIPNQVHARELKKILENAAQYLPFLNTVDDASGLTVAEQIVQLYSFQIPYYVGPLGQVFSGVEGYNVWAKRRPGEEKGRVLPWNFEQKIDVTQAAEAFINRMVRHCTYLKGERVLPKQSLMYEKFMVLNELNNLRINGEKPPVKVKQQIFEERFMKGKRVNHKQLVSALMSMGLIEEGTDYTVTGIDQDCKASLSSYGKFKGILGEDIYSEGNREMLEQIIFWGTVYGDDTAFLKARIQESYGDRLEPAQIKRICGMKFTGWGNLSKEFLELEGASKEDGVCRPLLTALWETNDNLMQLLSDRYTYKEALEKRMVSSEKPLAQWQIEDLDEFYLSPSVKRMVWQAMRIVQEITEVQGYAPAKIFVEMARDDAKTKAKNKGKRSVPRKTFLENCYKHDKEWLAEIKSCDESALRRKKLYLYYMQRGQSMYSGEPIALEKLLAGNDMYDIDHIYPQHFLKDDSIENNLVLVEKDLNARKSDQLLRSEIRKKQTGNWKKLLAKGAITQEKFNRLTRTTPFTSEELAGFINRQLVETRQGTKAIVQIFQQAFAKQGDTRVIPTKAGVATDFRHKFDLPKARCVNNLHHAHDAYLNIVVGNVYNTKFTDNALWYIEKEVRSGQSTYHMDKLFEYDVARNGKLAWKAQDKNTKAPGTIATVKEQLARCTVLQTRRSYMAHGGITQKETIYSKDVAKAESYFPVKTSDTRLANVDKYGGRTGIAVTSYALVEYKSKNKILRHLEKVPAYIGSTSNNQEKVQQYFENIYKQSKKRDENCIVSLKLFPIRIHSLIFVDGFYYYLAGATGDSVYLKDAMPLYLNANWMTYVHKIEKAVDREDYSEIDDNGRSVLTQDKNNELYALLLNKMENTIYCHKKGAIVETIRDGKEVFKQLKVEDQCVVLMQIFAWYMTSQQSVNLTKIGGLKIQGTMRLGKNLTNCESAVLVEQSVTGLFERRIDLLKV